MLKKCLPQLINKIIICVRLNKVFKMYKVNFDKPWHFLIEALKIIITSQYIYIYTYIVNTYNCLACINI
jgi:hypothetical protein